MTILHDSRSRVGVEPKYAADVRPLFRSEAVEYVSARQYGTVIITHSVNHRILTGIFVSIALAFLGFFFLFSTTRKAQSQGILLPTTGVIRVVPGQAGVITEKNVTEGQSVKAGYVMFVLSGERSSADVVAAQKTISELLQGRRDSFYTELKQSALQARQRIAAAERRAANIGAEITRAAAQIGLQQHRVSLAEQAFKRYADLRATSYISEAQLQDKQAELLDQRQRLADLRRIESVSQRELTSAQADMRDMQLQAQREAAALQRNASAIEQDLIENEARREILVRAPQDGVVTAIAAELGQTVAPNMTLASVLPAGALLEAEIYVASRSIGFVKPGMDVLLRYQAYPYQKFGQYRARVREIAHTSVGPGELGVPQSATSEPLYRIRLTLEKQTIQAYGKSLPLKSGMLVDASILLDHRRLYEWVLEPLFSISGRI